LTTSEEFMREVERDERFMRWREVLLLWAGVLLGPVTWALQMQLGYMLVQPACMSGRNLSLHIVTIIALALAAVGGLIAWRNWQRAGQQWPSDETAGPRPRSRFMGVLGLLMSAMFFVVIFAQGIASFVLHPCQP
jgi:hypothetical protein